MTEDNFECLLLTAAGLELESNPEILEGINANKQHTTYDLINIYSTKWTTVNRQLDFQQSS